MDDRNKASSPPDAKTVMAPNAPSGNAKEKTRLLDDGGMFPVGTPQPSSASMREQSAPVAMVPVPGARINQYELIRELGAGGMGTVFLARDLKLGRRVAIKFLQTQHPELNQRFILEARATAKCSHENIVIIYEVGEHFGAPYMVLEFLAGSPLDKVLDRGLLQTPARAVEIMIPVIRALVCAHEQEIAHRDLKPENVFITESGTIKVLDFGIAKVLHRGGQPEMVAVKRPQPSGAHIPISADAAEKDTHLTRSGSIMGTPQYMSPEQWGLAGVDIDHRTDIWACGIMLFKMLAGRHPMAPLEGMQLAITALLDQPMPRLRDVAPGVPANLADVVDKCLQKRKADRYPTARALLEALEAAAPGPTRRTMQPTRSPYAGLAPFQEGDADRFFGRNREVAAFANRLRDRALLAVVGPSGVGKSSFLRAGVVPALKAAGEHWEAQVIRPGRNPMEALAHLLSPFAASRAGQHTINEEIAEQQELLRRLRAEPGYCATLLRSHARRHKGKMLLFVDQFEELFTLVPEFEERQAFLQCLNAIGDDASAPLRVVVSMRSDFLDRLAENPQFLNEIQQGLFFLTPPNRDGLRDALVQPAEMAGFQFEDPATVEDMLDHLESTPGALPLLQFAAAKLWDARDNAMRLLTRSSYEAMGGIGGALASHADSVLTELPAAQQAMTRQLFLRLITPERTRAVVSLAELQEELHKDPAEVQRLVDTLVSARLLTVQTTAADGGAASTTVEIVHESLVTSWPSLRRWLDENQDDAEILDRLRTAARQWFSRGRDPGLLWSGEAAEEATRWMRRYSGQLLDVQRAFLEAVVARATRAQRVKSFAVVGTMAFLGVMVVAAGVALVQIQSSKQEAERQAEVARVAEAEATKSLREVQEKERERQKAEMQRAAALKLAEKKTEELGLTYDQLKTKNAELGVAMAEAEKARDEAREAQKHAEKERAEAQVARTEALASKERVERLLAQERDRAKRLQDQLGSPIVDTLK